MKCICGSQELYGLKSCRQIQKVIYALGGTRTVLTMSGGTPEMPLGQPLYQLVTSSPILLSRTKL